MKSKPESYLPQSENDWYKTGRFDLNSARINGHGIRYAYTRAEGKATDLTVMVGGIPRDPERQRSLPLINKLYGRIAVLLADRGSNSLLYNHHGTGLSGGNLETDTLENRSKTLAELIDYIAEVKGIESVNIIGMSAGSYIGARASRKIIKSGLDLGKMVLQSPAAYPKSAEKVCYGPEFNSIVCSDWEITSSPVFGDLERLALNGTSLAISYFQHDDQTIPRKIQDAYHGFAQSLTEKGANILSYTIYGVEHNFRRPNTNHGNNIVNNDSVRTVASDIVDFIDVR